MKEKFCDNPVWNFYVCEEGVVGGGPISHLPALSLAMLVVQAEN